LGLCYEEAQESQCKGKSMPKKKTEAPRAPLKRPDGAKGIVVQLKPDGWRALRQLALDLDTSVQKLGVEAFTDLMAKHGRKDKIVGAWD
jgi:hypothetical protein